MSPTTHRLVGAHATAPVLVFEVARADRPERLRYVVPRHADDRQAAGIHRLAARRRRRARHEAMRQRRARGKRGGG